jgi:hypothetical protein
MPSLAEYNYMTMKKNPAYTLIFISLAIICLILSFAVSNHNTAGTDPEIRESVQTDSELEIIRERVISELLAPETEQSHIENLLSTIRDDGSWPDIDYEDVSRTGWEHRFHLEHIGDLSRAYKQPGRLIFSIRKLRRRFFPPCASGLNIILNAKTGILM